MLILSAVVGFRIMQQMYGIDALVNADSQVLTSLLTAQLQQLFTRNMVELSSAHAWTVHRLAGAGHGCVVAAPG